MEHDPPLDRPCADATPTDQSLFAMAVAASQDAIIASDLGGSITSWNPAATRRFGIDAADAVGQPISDFIPISPTTGLDADWRVTAMSLREQLGSRPGASTLGNVLKARSLSHQAIVHDLRGPVAMAGSLLREAMETPEASPASREKLITLAAQCIEQTSRQLEDVGLLFRACDDVERQRLDLMQVIQDVADAIPGLELDCDGVPQAALACRTTLVQMVRNVLENARRYAAGDDGVTRVHVSASRSPSHWLIHFDDEGPGVPAGELQSIFDPYVRGSSPSTTEGTGLGLAIVRAGAVAHGGSTHAENRADGGLRITVWIAR